MMAMNEPFLTPAETAAGALRVLRTGGWCQGKMRDGSKRCVMGAAMTLLGEMVYFTGYARAVSQVVHEQFPGRFTPELCVVEFNDHPDTTFADVEMVLEKVAACEDASDA